MNKGSWLLQNSCMVNKQILEQRRSTIKLTEEPQPKY